MLSNEQIFDGRWKFIEQNTQTMLSLHKISFTVNWATPVLFMGGLAVVALVIQKVIGGNM